MVVLLGPTGREGPGLGDFALGAEPFPLSCLPFSAAKLRDLLSTTLPVLSRCHLWANPGVAHWNTFHPSIKRSITRTTTTFVIPMMLSTQ